MKKGTARHVAMRCGPPMGKYMNRPSVEYTGSGDQLCYDGFGGRWFRASIEAVDEGIKFFKELYFGDPDVNKIQKEEVGFEGNYVNYNDLYRLWNITESDFGDLYGYSPSEDYACNLELKTTLLTIGNDSIADKMGESVYVIEPIPAPYESYREY